VLARADAEEAVRLGEVEVAEDVVRHPRVVVLARVDDDLPERGSLFERAEDRRHLDEVRARAHGVHHGRKLRGHAAVWSRHVGELGRRRSHWGAGMKAG
jgi:hypothetical protein